MEDSCGNFHEGSGVRVDPSTLRGPITPPMSSIAPKLPHSTRGAVGHKRIIGTMRRHGGSYRGTRGVKVERGPWGHRGAIGAMGLPGARDYRDTEVYGVYGGHQGHKVR